MPRRVLAGNMEASEELGGEGVSEGESDAAEVMTTMEQDGPDQAPGGLFGVDSALESAGSTTALEAGPGDIEGFRGEGEGAAGNGTGGTGDMYDGQVVGGGEGDGAVAGVGGDQQLGDVTDDGDSSGGAGLRLQAGEEVGGGEGPEDSAGDGGSGCGDSGAHSEDGAHAGVGGGAQPEEAQQLANGDAEGGGVDGAVDEEGANDLGGRQSQLGELGEEVGVTGELGGRLGETGELGEREGLDEVGPAESPCRFTRKRKILYQERD